MPSSATTPSTYQVSVAYVPGTVASDARGCRQRRTGLSPASTPDRWF
ncbi:MAG: hypothetical protein ABEH81_10555 [Halopenitus sp.]